MMNTAALCLRRLRLILRPLQAYQMDSPVDELHECDPGGKYYMYLSQC